MGFFKAVGEVVLFLTTPFNDYELAITSSKQLEGLLESEWGAVRISMVSALHGSRRWRVHQHRRDIVQTIILLVNRRGKGCTRS